MLILFARLFQKHLLLALLLVMPIVVLAEGDEAPRTGDFSVVKTPVEVLGEPGAKDVSEILSPNEEISWQLYVPEDYSAENPPGVIVYVSPSERGGPPETWNNLLSERNLIWIGANNAGNKTPISERMLRALIAPTVLQQSYVINPERCYIAGFSGGGKTATRIATISPELFKGGIYIGGTVFWGENIPSKIDLIRQNHHVFLVGTYDPALTETQRVYNNYLDAGLENTELITVRNYRHRMPPSDYFERAVAFLDSRIIEPVDPPQPE